MKLWNRHTKPEDQFAVYIGRGTQWGNPFKVSEELPQGEAANKYRQVMADRLARGDPVYRKMVSDLVGQDNIMCSCSPKPCHGDTFVEIFEKIREIGDVKAGIRAFTKANGYSFGPDTDGIDHINVYSKGKTQLGRALTNFSSLSVDIPGHDFFASMEGYWYWLSTGMKHDELRFMTGFEAKQFGKKKEKVPVDDFQERIKEALDYRYIQAPWKVRRLFKNSTLPLTHYYHYGDDASVMYTDYDWITDHLTLQRERVRKTWYKVVIAGSRRYTDYDTLLKVIDKSGYPITEVVCGEEPSGVDALGKRYQEENHLALHSAPADWDQYGKAAGFIRNGQMADYADAAIVICVNSSPGSMDMIRQMRKRGKPVYEHHITI